MKINATSPVLREHHGVTPVRRSVPAAWGNNPDAALNSQLRTLALNVIMTRARYAARLGMSFGGNRDLYSCCGYKKVLNYADFWNMFERGGIAARIVSAYPDATWMATPEVTDDDDPEKTTAFEQSWLDLLDKIPVYNYLQRADIIAGVGQYAVVLLGLDGGDKLDVEPTGSHNLMYLQVYAQDSAQIVEWETDQTNPRYGKPKTYLLETVNEQMSGTATAAAPTLTAQRVHWKRVVHVVDNPLLNDSFGEPRLRAVFNRLQDLETVMGGSAEGYWQGGFPGLSLEASDGLDLNDKDIQKNIESEVNQYVHGYRRFMKLAGMTAKSLGQQVSDPTNMVDTILKVISGTKGIPVRILTGAEMGELASTQDRDNWDNRVRERRGKTADPYILRPFVQRCIDLGVLRTPAGNKFRTTWPQEENLSQKDKANLASIDSTILKNYASTPGADVIFPTKWFYRRMMRMSDKDADQIEKDRQEREQDEQAQAEADRRAQEAALAAQKPAPNQPPIPPAPAPPTEPTPAKKPAKPAAK